MSTKIEWCDETINPQGWGCYGPGGTPEEPRLCPYCYAKRIADNGRTKCDLCRKFIPHWHPERLELPGRWKKPRSIFWQDMGDLFHPFSPYMDKSAVLETCIEADQHTHLFLTKWPQGYLEFESHMRQIKNAFYGTTVTCQDDIWRVVELLKLSAKGFKVFLSIEPFLSPVDLTRVWVPMPSGGKVLMNVLGRDCNMPCQNLRECDSDCPHFYPAIHAVIIGAQTGEDAPPSHPNWLRTLRDQCEAADVPFFLKSRGPWVTREEALVIFGPKYDPDNAVEYAHIGKRKYRLLDGVEHNDLPWKR